MLCQKLQSPAMREGRGALVVHLAATPAVEAVVGIGIVEKGRVRFSRETFFDLLNRLLRNVAVLLRIVEHDRHGNVGRNVQVLVDSAAVVGDGAIRLTYRGGAIGELATE